jgi:hypothetical protein
VCFFVSAGVEGGSRRKFEDEWTLRDVEDQQSFWRRTGPPLYITGLSIAAALGVELVTKTDAPEKVEQDVKQGALSIADLAAGIAMPGEGGDTLAASRAIFEKMKGGFAQ